MRTSLLARGLERYTAATVTDPGVLQRELDEVLRRGWGATAEEYETGLNAVAAPVRDAEGQVMAALSVSGPSFRFAVVSSPAVAPQLVVGADELSRRLGHVG